MKFVGITDNYKLTKENLSATISVVVIVVLCIISCFGVVFAMNSNDNIEAHESEVAEILSNTTEPSDEEDLAAVTVAETSEETTTEETTTEETTTEETTTEETTTEETTTEETTTEETTSETTTEVTTTTSETTKAKPTATSTPKPTKKPTATPKPTEKPTEPTEPAIEEKKVDKRVYTSSKVNLRKGPGTTYAIVRQLQEGEAIDVVAHTSNGWYKTIKGNYVNDDYTTDKAPTPTPTPKPEATKKPTPKPTKKPTPKPTKKPESSPSKDGMTSLGDFEITFYGPQKYKDKETGEYYYSNWTASGTTCKQGKTIAADWSILPKGTKIYIENDPLGGDGYYIVEDKGPGVKGSQIDIYADDGESGNYHTTHRKVYIVN